MCYQIFCVPSRRKRSSGARFNCHGQITYREIWESLFREVGLPIKDEYARFGVSDVVDTLRQSDDKMVIFIIDEFDRIGDPDIDILFADTVKALSDFDIDTTLIMVGVADDVDDLITEHASIERCLVQVRVPRMPSEELAQIVRHGISAVGMDITEDAVDRICTLSLGLPHYGHALGLASGRAAVYEHSEAVEGRHVYAAVDTLIEESAQSILQQFDLATGSPRREIFISRSSSVVLWRLPMTWAALGRPMSGNHIPTSWTKSWRSPASVGTYMG